MAISIERGGKEASAVPSIKVLVLGPRGIVDVQGGIEMHCRKLYPLLARLDCAVEVIQRTPYYRRPRRETWHGVALTYLWSPRGSGLETAVHSLLGVLYAALKRPDILHLHAVGPALLAPLARLLGLRVVVTHHAADYRREKWGAFAKLLLKTGERFGMRFAHHPIVVSEVLRESVRSEYGVQASLIPNGVPRFARARTTGTLEALGLVAGRYVMCVARLDKVKRQLDLVEAFERARMPGWKLVLVGAIDERNAYAQRIVRRCAANPLIVLAGFQQGRPLGELFSYCGLFVLPSSLEGHPIAVLEALAYGARVLVSDLPETRALPLSDDCYFPVGDIDKLASLLAAAAADECRPQNLRDVIREKYSWRRAAQLTRSVYRQVLDGDL
ncbi:MAG: glycosyltransferase family 4 protein [Gammaproteobacteria bacterium]